MSQVTPQMANYYFINKIWINGNVVMFLPFSISCIVRLFNKDKSKSLWTDHFARICLIFSWTFYIFDMYYKYPIDGSDSICEKAFYIHHIASLAIFPPLFINKNIPWWIGPIGFMHSICIKFPEIQFVNYIYAAFLFVFHYNIYQQPYSKFWGYRSIHFTMNFIWIFCLMLLVGNCSNYLPTGPDE